MNCNCGVTNVVLSIVILIVAIWQNIFSPTANMWITIVASALILVHSLMHPHTSKK